VWPAPPWRRPVKDGDGRLLSASTAIAAKAASPRTGPVVIDRLSGVAQRRLRQWRDRRKPEP
jgi:hypothetical protein